MSKILVHATKDKADKIIGKLKNDWWALCFNDSDFISSGEYNLQLLHRAVTHNNVFLFYAYTIKDRYKSHKRKH